MLPISLMKLLIPCHKQQQSLLLSLLTSLYNKKYNNNVLRSFSEWFNPFHATSLFLYPLKTLENLENLWFAYVFREYRNRPVV